MAFRVDGVSGRLLSGFFVWSCIMLLMCSSSVSAEDAAADLERLPGSRAAVIDLLLQHAVSRGLIGGAVVLVGNHQQTLYAHAVGRAGFDPQSPALTLTTRFDVASLTKVFATAPAIMRLLDQERLSLLAPLSHWLPECSGCTVTLLQLLTHTSGLQDVSLDPVAPLTSIFSAAVSQASEVPANRFRYADINFILLGSLVKQVTSMELDQYCHESFYKPLGMSATGFRPDAPANTAATLGASGDVLQGVVQDERARILGGVAGHAGLFSTAEDLGVFMRMLMNNGILNGTRVLSARAVSQMTAPYFANSGLITRGLGWDRSSPFDAPRGKLFSEVSFGHTGYSGVSVWMDPELDLFVVLLTTRFEYRDRRAFNRLRSDISTVTVSVFAGKNTRNSGDVSAVNGR